MEDQPVMLHISSPFMDLKKAYEEATFRKSCDLGNESGSPHLINLQIKSLSLLTEISNKELKSIKILEALVLEDSKR